MGYSSDERNAAVSGLVQGTLSFPVDRLGVRNPNTPFEEVKELANSALLYDPDSVFYIINQAAKALGNSVKTEVELCNDLLDAVDDLSMPDKPIQDVASLSDAATSLSSMQSALARKGAIGASEFNRYNSAVTRATKEIGRTAKMTYVPRGSSQAIKDVVRSSPEAKADVLSLFRSIQSAHEDLTARVGYILEAYDQFVAANLSGIVGQRQLSRAASEMRELYDDLNSQTPTERTAVARASLLKVLANKSVVKALKTRVAPGDARVAQIAGTPSQYRISPAGTGTPADIGGSISAPWAVQASHSDRLRGSYNGNLVDVDLCDGTDSGVRGVQQARVDGINDGDFAVHSDISTPYPLVSNTQNYTVPTGGLFQLRVDGTLYECALTPGAGRTAANILTDLTTPGNWVTPPGVPPVTFSATTAIRITYNVGSPPASYAEREMEVVQGFLATPLLWPWSADVPSVGLVAADRTFGWNANNELWIHPNDYDDFISNPIVATLPDGAFPDFLITAVQVVAAVDAAATASSEEFEGLEVVDGVTGKSRVAVVSTWTRLINGTTVEGGSGSAITIKSDGLRPSGARRGLGTPSQLGMRTLGFSEGQESIEDDVGGQIVVKTLNRDVDFAAQVKASLVKESYFESTEGIWNAGGTLLKLQDADPTTDWPPASELKVVISAGGNKGSYGLSSYVWTNIAGYDFLVLSLDRRMRSEDAAVFQHFEVYSEHIELKSLVDTTASAITLSDPLTIPATTARKVLGLPLGAVYGSVNKMLIEKVDPAVGWKVYDARSRKIKIGDKVVNSSGAEHATVTSTSELENGLVGVSPVPNWLSLTNFTIESADYLAYQTFIADLEEWWDGFAYQKDLDSIDRVINTVLRSHPNKSRVDAVYSIIVGLRDSLTGSGAIEEIVEAFIVRPVSAASTAVRALADRGLDRAREMLLQGRFEEFFGTTSRNASHGSAFLDAAATAVVQDLNESNAAKARFSAVYMRKTGEWYEDQDPSTTFTDVEEELPDDELEEYWPGIDEDIQGEH